MFQGWRDSFARNLEEFDFLRLHHSMLDKTFVKCIPYGIECFCYMCENSTVFTCFEYSLLTKKHEKIMITCIHCHSNIFEYRTYLVKKDYKKIIKV